MELEELITRIRLEADHFHRGMRAIEADLHRVDGAVALAMAIGVAQTEGSRMIYEERPSFLVL